MDPLRNAMSLNEYVSQADEPACLELLKREKKGLKRRSFMLRIHSRLNYLRAHREREELVRVAR